MNELSIFNNEEFGELPTITKNGEPLFGATESAKILGFAKPHDAISSHVDEDDSVACGVIDSLGRKQKKKFITESGLYSLIFGAAKQGNNKQIQEKAKKFKRWVTSEVLPTIRKTGSYSTHQLFNVPQSLPEALRLAAELEEERQVLETKIKEDAPFTAFGKIVENSEGAINIGEFAKILYEKDGINLGRNKLLEWLRDRGYLIKNGKERNNPKQQYLEQGLFVSRTTVIARSEGQMQASTTMITGKGQIRITSELKAEVEARSKVFS